MLKETKENVPRGTHRGVYGTGVLAYALQVEWVHGVAVSTVLELG